jgi:hypothetical protein
MLDPSLRTTLVDCWRPETHRLSITLWEVGATLKDVSLITPLPISGKELVPTSCCSICPHNMSDLLGMEIPNTLHSGAHPRGVPLSLLISNIP